MILSETLVGTLDPTYTLLPGPDSVGVPASDLHIYLRIFYLFLGVPIIPRTYFIHGQSNPFFDLYRIGDHGKREINDLLTSGAVRVSGHSDPRFASFSGHLEITADEQHPLVAFDPGRQAYALYLDECLPSDWQDRFIWQDPKAVTSNFPTAFRECYLQLGGREEAFLELDRRAKLQLIERNKVNRVAYPEGKWGRNELCDLLRGNQVNGRQAVERTVEAAVAAYQKIFARSLPSHASSPRTSITHAGLRRDGKESDFPSAITTEFTSESIWEIGLDVLGSRPWSEVRDVAKGVPWQRWLSDFNDAIQNKDRKTARCAMDRLALELAKLYPPRKSMRTGWMQVVSSDPAATVGAALKVASTPLKVFLRLFTERSSGTNATERWFDLVPDILDVAAASIPWIYKMSKAERRETRLDYLVDCRMKEEQ